MTKTSPFVALRSANWLVACTAYDGTERGSRARLFSSRRWRDLGVRGGGLGREIRSELKPVTGARTTNGTQRGWVFAADSRSE